MLQINDVYLDQDQYFRILSILPEHIVWIEINNIKNFPTVISKNELFQAIESFETFRVDDPFQDIVLMQPLEGSITQIKRDENYNLIKPIIDHEQFYIPHVRSSLINEIIKNQKSTKQTLYRLLK